MNSQNEIRFAVVHAGVSASEQKAENKAMLFSDFAAVLSKPTVGQKDGAYIVRGECNGHRRDANMVLATMVVIDGDSSFNPGTGEVDELSAPEMSLAIQALDKLGLMHVVHTSHSHMQSPKGNRWRACIPLSRPVTKTEFPIINTAIHDAIQTAGCPVTQTKESGTFAQPWYLPRIAIADAPFEFSSCIDGKAFDVDAALAAEVPDEALAAFSRFAPTPPEIKAFNDKHPLHEVLRDHRYEKRGKKWIHPNSKSGAAGLWVNGELCYSHNGSDPLCDGRAHDSFDVYRILDHGGDRGAAMLAASEWENPAPLPTELLPVESFDTACLPRAFTAYAEDIADSMQCPIEYVAVGLMASLGGVVGNSVTIYPKQNGSWKVAPNLWGGLIGRPSAMKSPAMAASMRGVANLVDKARQEFSSASAEYELSQMVCAAKKDDLKREIKEAVKKGDSLDGITMPDAPETPEEKRYITNAGSVERIIKMLEQNPAGFIQSRDELSGWFRSMENSNNTDARSFWLEAWNGTGQSFSYDTVTHGHLYLPTGPCVSVMGTIQPGPLSAIIHDAESGKSGDDGLLQRFQLLAYPNSAESWDYVDKQPNVFAEDAMQGVFDRVSMLEGSLRFAPDAQQVFVDWYTNLMACVVPNEQHLGLEAHLSKYSQLMPALALLIHLADDGFSPVSADAARKAVAWCRILESHARRIYAIGQHVGVKAACKVIAMVADKHLPYSFNVGELQRKKLSGLMDAAQVKQALMLLETYGWAQTEIRQTGGRPATIWHMHPETKKFSECSDTLPTKGAKSLFTPLVGAPNVHSEKPPVSFY